MELTRVGRDTGFAPTYLALATAYQILLDTTEEHLDLGLGALGVERNELRKLAMRYGAQPDTQSSFQDLLVLTFLLSRFGRGDGVTPHKFEAALVADLNSSRPAFFAPFWVPAVAGLRQRDVYFPLLAPRRSQLVLAYQGLLEHLRFVVGAEDPSELSMTAILWRVAALVDGLVPDPQPAVGVESRRRSLYDKMNEVRARVVQSPTVTEREKRLWDPFTEKFANRRHALSHLVERQRQTFETSVEYAMGALDELIRAATALGLAVLQVISNEIAHLPAPRRAWDCVWEETQWIDGQL